MTKTIKLAAKSRTVKYGLFGIGSILGSVFGEETIKTLIGDLFSQNYAHAIYYTVVTALSVLTGAGIIKGRVDGDSKPPLRSR